MNFLNPIRKTIITDIESIAIDLTPEYMSIDSEYQLFRIHSLYLRSKMERSIYNRRKRGLFHYRKQPRKKIASNIASERDCYIVDSIPLELCKLSRSSRSSIGKGNYQSAPDQRYCATQKMLYYGYKQHAVCTIDGLFSNFELTKNSISDVHYLKDFKRTCAILEDKGYLNTRHQPAVFESKQIKLEVPMKIYRKGYRKQHFIFRKLRKRIEPLFSRLCDQFMIRRNYAKSFDGCKNRILSKIMALTIIQRINKLNNKNIDKLNACIP